MSVDDVVLKCVSPEVTGPDVIGSVVNDDSGAMTLMTYVLKGSEPKYAPSTGRLEGSPLHGLLEMGDVSEEECWSTHAGTI